jgi:hypothetical protein
MDGFHEPRSLNPAPPDRGDEPDRGCDRAQPLPRAWEHPLAPWGPRTGAAGQTAGLCVRQLGSQALLFAIHLSSFAPQRVIVRWGLTTCRALLLSKELSKKSQLPHACRIPRRESSCGLASAYRPNYWCPSQHRGDPGTGMREQNRQRKTVSGEPESRDRERD